MPNSNLYQTYDFGFTAGGRNREDLLDIVVNIAPWETPFFSTAPKTTCKHTTHEWIEDTLAAVSENSAYWEGQTFSAQPIQTRSRLSNITQIFRKDIDVSNTQRAVDPAGVADEYNYQISIALKEIARNVERRIFGTAASATGSGDSARLMKVLDDFIVTNTASSTVNNGHIKSMLDSLAESCFTAGGVPNKLFLHPNSKTKFADHLSNVASAYNYRNIASMDNAVVGNMEVYYSNFGPMTLIPDRFIPTATITATAGNLGGRWWLVEQPKIRVAFLRPIRHVPLPPNGDSTRGMVLGELTLEVMAETAHAKAINVVQS